MQKGERKNKRRLDKTNRKCSVPVHHAHFLHDQVVDHLVELVEGSHLGLAQAIRLLHHCWVVIKLGHQGGAGRTRCKHPGHVMFDDAHNIQVGLGKEVYMFLM